ncbi:MAG: hypothetical protein WC346_19035 [Methanogenium sp.]
MPNHPVPPKNRSFNPEEIKYRSTMSRVVRIQEDAIDIALTYGPTISEGIRAMEVRLKRAERNQLDIEAVRIAIREELESFGKY